MRACAALICAWRVALPECVRASVWQQVYLFFFEVWIQCVIELVALMHALVDNASHRFHNAGHLRRHSMTIALALVGYIGTSYFFASRVIIIKRALFG